MTKSEKRLLFGGVAIGAILAIAAIELIPLSPPWRRFVPTANEPAANTPPSVIPADDEPTPEGPVAVELTDPEQRSIGIQLMAVRRQTIQREILTTGKVEEAETGLSTISARIGGRIDQLLLRVTGENVTAGQPLALIYSPEIASGFEEYRLALETRQRLTSSKEPEAIANADELIRASHRRLELWGLTAAQIENTAASPEPAARITIYSPVTGTVTKRSVTEGQYIKEGDALFSITDLSAVWVQADIFESDISMIRTGQTASIRSPALPGGPVRGTVSFLKPSADPGTRTVSVRIQVENPKGQMRPGMFVQVSLQASQGPPQLSVPRSAVLDTGKEKVVYVAKGDGVFEKRLVEAKAAGDDDYAVTKGLNEGERVVTHGNFLLDSQTRLTGAVTGMFGGSKAFGAGGAPDSKEPAVAGSAITFKVEPSQPKGGAENTFHVTVSDPMGKPVSDAEVRVTLVMPAMPSMGMPEMRSTYTLKWNGSEYTGAGAISMAGPWNVSVDARRGSLSLGALKTRIDAR